MVVAFTEGLSSHDVRTVLSGQSVESVLAAWGKLKPLFAKDVSGYASILKQVVDRCPVREVVSEARDLLSAAEEPSAVGELAEAVA